MFWSSIILILLIGTAVILFVHHERTEIRQLEKGLLEATKLEQEINQQQVVKTDRKLSSKPFFDPNQRNDGLDKELIDEQDGQINDIPDQTPLQPEVVIPNIEIPTDAELATYSEEKSTKLLLLVSQVLDDVREKQDEYIRQSLHLSQQSRQTESIAESLGLLKQSSNFSEKSKAYDSEAKRLLEEKDRIRRHIRGL